MEICNPNSCTGCFACKASCPKNAIEKKIDQVGRTVPSIDSALCVECGLCQKVCPVNEKPQYYAPQKCYASWSQSETDRNTCASGGIATGLGRYMIEQGGVVFGTYFQKKEHLVLEFGMADTMDGLERFKTSKYVQADTADSYQNAKRQLEQGRLVLYVGTPCQIAGLKGFLRKEYENLITVDIICHGVPPVTYLREHQKNVCGGREAEIATFRGKDDYSMCFYEKSGKQIYKKPASQDYYFRAFLNGLSNRENCYECPYARKERVSDLTIGDFWGLDKSTLQHEYNGKVSVILVNTEKADRFLKQCEDKFYLEERAVEEAVRGNTQLRETAARYQDRDKFLQLYEKMGFVDAIKATCIKAEIRSECRNKRKKIFRRGLRKIKRLIKR